MAAPSVADSGPPQPKKSRDDKTTHREGVLGSVFPGLSACSCPIKVRTRPSLPKKEGTKEVWGGPVTTPKGNEDENEYEAKVAAAAALAGRGVRHGFEWGTPETEHSRGGRGTKRTQRTKEVKEAGNTKGRVGGPLDCVLGHCPVQKL